MSTNVLKITKLLKEIVNEVGDLTNISPLAYDLTKNTFTVEHSGKSYRGQVNFTFLNEKGLSVFEFPPVVEVLNIKTGYNVGYSIEGVSSQFVKGDTKLLLAVLKTVSILVAHHIQKNPDSIYLFFAESKTGIGMEDSQKLTLYHQILAKNLPQGFRIGKTSILENVPGLFICKIK